VVVEVDVDSDVVDEGGCRYVDVDSDGDCHVEGDVAVDVDGDGYVDVEGDVEGDGYVEGDG